MILFCSNADTELLALRSIVEDLPGELRRTRGVHPDRAGPEPEDPDVELVVVRLLGGRGAWELPFDRLRADCVRRIVPLVALGGEATPDAELAQASTVPAGVVAESHRYLAAGGPANMANLLRFVSDTLLMTGHGFDRPTEVAAHGVWDGAGLGAPGATRHADRPLIAVVFYRAHLVAGNTTAVADLCAVLEAAGADALAIFTYSLRADAYGAVPAVALAKEHGVDIVITST
ncbi:MAG: cobaltochelatase subunit CobN, partial [Actinomycetota bacterium]|nr:cobaltochelatase subunit CobN [Actinomycetota bacterium]